MANIGKLNHINVVTPVNKEAKIAAPTKKIQDPQPVVEPVGSDNVKERAYQ